jgi:hypothetical protein
MMQNISINYDNRMPRDHTAFIQDLVKVTRDHNIPAHCVDIPPATPEKIMVVCDDCGEAFDNMIRAFRHDKECGDEREFRLFRVATETEAM